MTESDYSSFSSDAPLWVLLCGYSTGFVGKIVVVVAIFYIILRIKDSLGGYVLFFLLAFSPAASPPLSLLIDSDLLCKELGVELVECTMIANLDNSNLILPDGKDSLI